MTRRLNECLATITIAGRTYPYKSAPGCRVCNSSFRVEAEGQILGGRTWASIAQALPKEAGLSAWNLRDHYKADHVPLTGVAVQRSPGPRIRGARRGHRPGRSKDGEPPGVRRDRGGPRHRRLVAGEVEPTTRDGLTAADHLTRFAVSAPAFDEVDVVKAFIIYHDNVRKFLDQDWLTRFGRALVTHPGLKQF